MPLHCIDSFLCCTGASEFLINFFFFLVLPFLPELCRTCPRSCHCSFSGVFSLHFFFSRNFIIQDLKFRFLISLELISCKMVGMDLIPVFYIYKLCQYHMWIIFWTLFYWLTCHVLCQWLLTFTECSFYAWCFAKFCVGGIIAFYFPFIRTPGNRYWGMEWYIPSLSYWINQNSYI